MIFEADQYYSDVEDAPLTESKSDYDELQDDDNHDRYQDFHYGE